MSILFVALPRLGKRLIADSKTRWNTPSTRRYAQNTWRGEEEVDRDQ